MSEITITIRTLHSPDEMEAAVDLQKVYWGEDMADLVPGHMLTSIANYGGHVHGAFDGAKMVGMLVGFLGADIQAVDMQDAPSRMLIMSKRMVVLPEYRSHKIGEKLKLAQADYARKHGIQLVTWTFDPLLSRNAYLNLHKLGAIGQKYIENYFGDQSNNPVLQADRLVANLWVHQPYSSNRPEYDLTTAPIVNAVTLSPDGLLVPQAFHQLEHPVVRFEIPMEFQPIQTMDSTLAEKWRDHIRVGFNHLLAANYIATDFLRAENRVFYVFTQDDGRYKFM